MFIIIPEICGFYDLVELKLTKFYIHMPLFFIGTALADIESWKDYRPLDEIRNLHWGVKILINTPLFLIFLIYGSWKAEGRCLNNFDGDCPLWEYATFHGAIVMVPAYYAASFSIILLALTSDVAQWILSTWVMQFLGQISFTLYLIHELFVEWLETDTYYRMEAAGFDPETAVLYVFLIWTPVLIFVSWILEILVDRPSKNFAYQLDIQARVKRPPPPKPKPAEEGEEQEE